MTGNEECLGDNCDYTVFMNGTHDFVSLCTEGRKFPSTDTEWANSNSSRTFKTGLGTKFPWFGDKNQQPKVLATSVSNEWPFGRINFGRTLRQIMRHLLD